MGFLQSWLDEPDASIAQFAKAFYACTFLFMAVFGWKLVDLVLHSHEAFTLGDAVALITSLFLTTTMYSLALDGRRSYKVLKASKADDEASGPTAFG